MTAPADPFAPVRAGSYLRLLGLAAALGVPVAAVAYGFLKLTELLQEWVYADVPDALGFRGAPIWWPAVPLLVAGLVVGATARYLPGAGGEAPVDGFSPGRVAAPITLPGITVAALASIGLGAVVGPEGPLVALGGGLAFLVVKLARRGAPEATGKVVAATGSFAAISTLLGSPLAGAFLLMEAAALGGAMATIVLLPGLVSAGIGALVFTGLDSLTGFGTFSLAIPNLPDAAAPTGAEFGWALAVGLAAAPLCAGLRRLARLLRPVVERSPAVVTPVLGLAVAALAIGYAAATDKSSADVLFSGQTDLPRLIENSATYPVGVLLLLILCKLLAYGISLSAFRGGPTFPAMFIGAAGGVALSHLPGLPLVTGVAIGIGAMTVGILRLPMTTVLLTTLFLGAEGITVMPVVIVAVVTSYVVTIRLTPPAEPASVAEPARAGRAGR